MKDKSIGSAFIRLRLIVAGIVRIRYKVKNSCSIQSTFKVTTDDVIAADLFICTILVLTYLNPIGHHFIATTTAASCQFIILA